MARKPNPRSRKVSSRAAAPDVFLAGICGLVLSMVLAFTFLSEAAKVGVIAVVLGLSCAGIATAITGILTIKSKYLVAGGPLAIFVFTVCVFIAHVNPGALAGVPFLGKAR